MIAIVKNQLLLYHRSALFSNERTGTPAVPALPFLQEIRGQAPNTPGMNIVYLLRCADGTLYCGWTTDMPARLEAHNAGKGAKYTRSRRPVSLVYSEAYEDRREALSREWHIKRMTRSEKEKLIARDK